MKLLFIILFSLISQSAAACQFDTDCNVGSQCLKDGYNINGVCAGGMNPGNRYDSNPVYNQMNPSDALGNSCMFDLDCGYGLRCLKSNYSINGVCR